MAADLMADLDHTLPEPAPDFEWVTRASGPALRCRPLAAHADHFYTTRAWRLGSRVDGDRADAWTDVAAAAGVAPARLVRARQVHAADVRLYRSGDPAEPLPDADIVAASGVDAALAIQTADCAPIAIVDPRTGAAAVAHAGWRGLALGVPGRAVAALVDTFGARHSDLLAAIGPCIGACCYEVGEDVRHAFRGSGSDAERWFSPEAKPSRINPSMPGVRASGAEGKWFFDGWCAARDQLRAAGVAPDRIFVAELCTASHPDVLPSYRRDGKGAGRIAAVVKVSAGCRPPDPSPRSPADPRAR